MNKTKKRVYFDTNAINYLCDKFKGKSKRYFKNFDVLFSWALLDEIKSCPSISREMDLAKFMWQISNRKILMTIGDLISQEIKSLLGQKRMVFSDYFDSGSDYLIAWKEAKKGKTPQHLRNQLQSKISESKKRTLDWLKLNRQKWRPEFNGGGSLPTDWPEAYALLAEDNHFNEYFYHMMKTLGCLYRFTDPNKILNMNHKLLQCSSIGVEFTLALIFIIDSQSKKIGSPDLGDLYDVKHAYYLGLSDIFVTSDQRVLKILRDLIDTKETEIYSANSFYDYIVV